MDSESGITNASTERPVVISDVETAVECVGDDIQENISTNPCDHSHYEATIQALKKELEQVVKVKDAMVMRYATSEKEVIKKSKEVETVEKQLKAQIKETESLQRKTKMLTTERERLAGMIDLKVCEIQSLHKDLEKAKEEISNKDFKVKWTYSKLQNEIEAHKATTARLEKCESDLIESMAEAERMRSDCRQMIESCSPEPYLSNSGIEHSAETHLNASADVKDHEKPLTNGHMSSGARSPAAEAFLKEIEILKQKHKYLVEENNSLSVKVQALEQAKHQNEHQVTRLEEANQSHSNQISDLEEKLREVEAAKSALMQDLERNAYVMVENDQLRELNADLESDMNVCRQKEAELLEYTQQVTLKNVELQSQLSAFDSQCQASSEEISHLQKTIVQLKADLTKYEATMELEKQSWRKHELTLVEEMSLRDETIKRLQSELDESKGECAVLKRRQDSSLKELRKELDGLRRICKDVGHDDAMSRTSSNTSLNQTESKMCDNCPSSPVDIEIEGANIPDQRNLVERIVKLQRSLAKKQEKIEFLQEHSKQLLDSLQNKSKIIQAYAMNQVGSSIAPDISSHHKSEMIKHGFDAKFASEPITLELSMELNRKFQAVLEDALLKNLTMKESMRTLGSEICRLTEINKELSTHVTNHKPSH